MAEDATPWLAMFGRAHTLFLHLPLGILPAIALLEFGAPILRRPPAMGAVRTLSVLCALAAATAVASGLVLGGEDGYTGDLVGRHKWFGIGLGVLCVLAAITSFAQRRRSFRIVLLLALVVMVPAGHLGGSLTHGEDFLFPKPKSAAQTPKPVDANASEFTRTIAPILERVCTGCHNEEKKKGELLMTTEAGLRAGGENGPVLVPGKPDESPMLQRCLLPPDHDDHMPPEGKPQPTAAEIETLRAWIAAGAR